MIMYIKNNMESPSGNKRDSSEHLIYDRALMNDQRKPSSVSSSTDGHVSYKSDTS